MFPSQSKHRLYKPQGGAFRRSENSLTGSLSHDADLLPAKRFVECGLVRKTWFSVGREFYDSIGTGVVLCAGMRCNVVGMDRDTDDDMVGLAWERASHCWKFVLDHNIVALDERGTATEEPGQKLTEDKDWPGIDAHQSSKPRWHVQHAGTTPRVRPLPSEHHFVF